MKSRLPALLPFLLALSCAAVPGPNPPSRAGGFLGIHFDFHANAGDTNIGARTTPAMVQQVIDRVRPDYIQIDCKGHPGWSSYPTKVGSAPAGMVGDPLRIWRDVTRSNGVALVMHYSGVWDQRAVKTHPEWAARNAGGQPDGQAASVFGPYVDQLLIPQLRELAGDYGVDGVWVDGDCWGALPDYGADVVKAFCAKTGAAAAPAKKGEPYWNEWMDFNRDGFRAYVRRYVAALQQSHPAFEVYSNWAFSDHMPEPVTIEVAGLSGDFSPEDSVNSARFAGRCLENQGKAWDLMSWSFRRSSRAQKPAVQLMQEAAVVLAQGGGYQAYFKQAHDGAVLDLAQMDVMAEVAKFCRERQPFTHRSEAVPQVAILYSRAGHYRDSGRLFAPWGSAGVDLLRRVLKEVVGAQQSVQIVSEHHLAGKMKQWPVIVVPGWTYIEAAFRDELAAYAKAGGKLLLVGSGPAALFSAAPGSNIVTVAAPADVPAALAKAFPEPLVEVSGSRTVDVSLRRLNGRLAVHLVNTSGRHDAPDGALLEAIPPAGPLQIVVRLDRKPSAIVAQPAGIELPVTWADGRALVTLAALPIYTILEVR
jgi:hypothetical protein